MDNFVCYSNYTKLGYCPKGIKLKYSKDQINDLLEKYRELKEGGLNPCAIVERNNSYTIRRLKANSKIVLDEREGSNCWIEASLISRGLLFEY